ncbi:MAG TPA: undecaprenyldiphospho-muramoylpentapeptide beta-N-acetylglucosaminyltransferase [Gammaproteobacteria bacterium]|nr:undecaprenyldiphospho-muramoylpentapeptide beta-N-acetylglucosaminyltransferase [Gammaproteobacteria bacterium]
MIKRILIAAGGTGGHIIPALAVAKRLQSAQVEIHWLGTRQGLEQQIVPPQNIPIHYIAMPAIRGKGFKRLLAAPFHLLRATWQTLKLIKQLQPDVVAGFGGFVTAPAGLAAWLARKPLILHEQNAVSGLSNRYLARLATQVFQAFPNAFAAQYHAITSGNPVRVEIAQVLEPEMRFTGRQAPMRLLILGGSQGAALFNQILPATLAALPFELRPEVWHSAGKQYAKKTEAAYVKHGITAKVTEFITDMAGAYAWADLVICRSGALTVAELAAAGIGSILIPFPFAVDDHQTKNAAWLANADAAILIAQSTLTEEKLSTLLLELSQDKSRLLQMAKQARQLAMPEATEVVAQGCLNVLVNISP